ncbi:MAG: twin-arginine translocase TatA/TatE family subunit [Acidobacteriaceae bacterium]
MPLPAILILSLPPLAHIAGAPLPPVQLATFGIPDTLFLVVLALIVFGPKKLPEISRQVGKLLYEFRKASNDFKFQIEEELRASEQAERQKELAAQAATAQPATPIAITAGETVSAEPVAETETVHAPETIAPDLAAEHAAPEAETPATEANAMKTPTILPPASGLPVSTRSPYRALENTEAISAAGPENEAQALDEMRADAQEAVEAAAAENSYTQSGDAVPTHHG